jgi:hypothetical protein
VVKLGDELAPAPVRDAGGEPPSTPPAPCPTARAVHRWRDLDRRSRRWALAVAAALLVAPAAALVELLPDWTPNGDPALMALRALDVGTDRTPLLGQPSQSIVYADSVASVHHPGPIHFYLLALPVRVLGADLAMPVVSAAVAGICLVVAAWAVFRQLGRTGGAVAAALLALVAFTAGAASMINPVSSVIAGYPLLLTVVLAWCLACGDVRLLPLTVAAASFTAQQHLSVVPATVVVMIGGVGLLFLAGWRERRWRDPAERRALVRSAGLASLLALVLWAPVLVQQAFGGAGNLSQMLWFAGHDSSERLGYGMAARQVAHAVGLPPLLGRTELRGAWLNSAPSLLAWVSAALVLGLVAVICVRWRASDARAARLGAMVAVVVVAGLYNGASVPAGLEQDRMTFYHWALPLALLVSLVVALAVVRAAGARRVRPRGSRALAAVLVVGVVAAPGLVNPVLDRTSSSNAAAYVSLERHQVDLLADAVAAHETELGDHPVVPARNVPAYLMYGETVLYALVERGIPMRAPLPTRFFVHDDRLVDRDRVTGGVVLVVDEETPSPAPEGVLVAELDLGTGFDVDAFRQLMAAAEAAEPSTVRLGPALAGSLTADERLLATAALQGLVDDPEAVLLNPLVLALLAERPAPASPALDPRLIARLRASLTAHGDDWRPGTPTRIRVYVSDRAEVLAFAGERELGVG